MSDERYRVVMREAGTESMRCSYTVIVDTTTGQEVAEGQDWYSLSMLASHANHGVRTMVEARTGVKNG